jgi:predicted outer membrane repeat protein
MLRRYVRVAVLLSLSVAPLAAEADVIHVPSDQPTIQQGLDAASPGDTVLVAADTYAGTLNRDLDFAGKGITLRGESGVLSTFIDGEGAGRGFLFHSGEDTTAVVESFTIQGAAADTGAGAKCSGGSSPKFVGCRFIDNVATARGGGVCCRASSPVFRFCEFVGNDALGAPYSKGGAIACFNGAAPLIQGCSFTANTAPNDVGGAVSSESSSPSLTGCTFSENTSLFGGGAVYASSSASLTITDCEFTANTGSQGGAIYTQSCAPTVTRCSFKEHDQRAVSLLYGSSTGHFSYCTFIDNVSHFHSFDGADATFSNCTFTGSHVTTGGVTMNEASPTFENCVFAFSTLGPSVACETGTETPSFARCVVFANEGGNDLCGAVSDTLHRDPRFCNLAGQELDLCQNSVCAPDNNPWSQLIGAQGVGCPDCNSAAQPATWGSIKALYR